MVQAVTGEIEASILNSNFSELDSKVENANSGQGDTVSSVAELNSKYPNGADFPVVAMESDGKTGYMYTWTNGVWKKGQLAQAMGIADGSIINVKIADDQVSMNKLTFLPVVGQKDANLFNRYATTKGSYIDPADGKEKPSDVFESSEFIELAEGETYRKNTNNGGAWYDAAKNYLVGVINRVNILSPKAGQKYFRYSVNKTALTTAMLVNGSLPTDYIEPIVLSSTMIGSDTIDKIENNLVELINWKSVSFGDNTLNFGKRFTVSNSKNGYYCLVLQEDDLVFELADGESLILSWDGKGNVTGDSSVFIKRRMSLGLNIGEILLATRITDKVLSPIPSIQSVIDTSGISPQPGTISFSMPINDKISKLAPAFYSKFMAKKEDLCVVLDGDSISTNNYYAAQRTDSKYRPPLMTEFSYVSYIEEQLRWDGQKYYRYDTTLFIETADTKESLEYDLANWDWTTTPNNRPAWTRILTGTNAKVSWKIPKDVWRCDFIYRTDAKNAANAKISISGGNNVLEVFDSNSKTWIEAHGYVYSAKESSTPISTPLYGNLMKSVYQRRLKMRFKTAIVNDSVVTIENQGSGRLTYWGVQTGIRKVMLDFIVKARGGHSIQKIENFEPWDLDSFEPSLILWELPILNHNMDVADASFNPKNMAHNTPDFFAQKFLVKRIQYKNKAYSPEVVPYVMWFGSGNNAIDNNNEWVYGYCTNGEKVSVPNYISRLISLLSENDFYVINMFNFYMDYAKKSSLDHKTSILVDTLRGSGEAGSSLTIDGGHFNTRGAKVTNEIFGSFFLE